MKGKNKKVFLTEQKQEKIKIYLTIFLIIFASIFAFITAYQSTKIVMTSIELSNLNSDQEVDESVNEIVFLDTNTLIKGQEYNIKLNINNLNVNSTYKIQFYINNINVKEIVYTDIESINTTINIAEYFNIEGSNDIYVEILENDVRKYYKNQKIYFVIPYQKQFLDNYEEYGVSTHFAYGIDGTQSLELVKQIGAKKVRDDCLWKWIIKEDGQYSFTRYDKWIKECSDNGISVIPIMFGPGEYAGDDNKISSQEEIDGYIEFITAFAKHYPQILEYEIWNEPNDLYTSEEDIMWYSKAVEASYKALKQINPDIRVISGATDTSDGAKVETLSFLNSMMNNNVYLYTDAISFHPYDVKKDNLTNELLYNKLNSHQNLINQNGGFIYSYATEYGTSTHQPWGMTEEMQAIKIVTQTSILKKYNVKSGCVYNVRNYGNNISTASNNYGILNYDYTPKPAYYALKKYYENTNGAEYIGTIDLADGLEAHVYNKDGKPKIITWATDLDANIDIPHSDFDAKDLYGNEIENTNGTLTVTTSPVYLDNVENKYYYQAISNMAIEKYQEFNEKFGSELEGLSNIQENIKNQITYMQNLGKIETGILENDAINAMKKHFDIGTQLIDLYKQGTLNIEYVKLSSMLDMLNDIGNSYEDLVTISVKSGDVDLQKTYNAIQEVEKLIEDNQDIQFVYPEKIIQFSKDYYNEAEYINSLEEENPIKNGIIASKNQHSELLAGWAYDFADLYIQEYIKNNPVNIQYSTTEITNKDVTATVVTNADIKIINNSSNNTYTFTKNGKFTFEYEIKGKQFEITATVNNIDKIAPVIKGVEQGQTYFTEQKVIPNATDENLKDVSLYLNGVKVNYVLGQAITIEGLYKIVATDIAGNSSSIEFQVMKKPEEEYIINNNTIKNIQYETTKSRFDKNIILYEKYKIERNVNSKTIELKDTDIIASGDILTTSSSKKYTLIVAGDLTKDGKVDIQDFVRMRRYLLGLRDLDEIETLTADANVDGKKLSISDYIRIRILILNQLSHN